MSEKLRRDILLIVFTAFAVAIVFMDFSAIEATQPLPTVSRYNSSPFNTDPNRPVKDILGEIAQGAVQQPERIGFMLAPFSALLVRLSQDDDATASRLLDATDILLYVTVLLTVVAVFQLGLAIYQSRLAAQQHSPPDGGGKTT